jgi:hypothetical protein
MTFAARPIAAFAAAALLGAACGSKDTAAPAPPDAREPATAATTPAPAAPETASRFHRVLELQGVSFAVTCDNDSSINQLRIEPAGLGAGVQPVLQDVDGTVVGAEVGDLDVDGSPEVYVFVQSAGSGSYGSLVAYAVDNRKSLSAIDLPPVTENEKAAKGYMGHDDFAVVENRLVQRFPIYRDGDTNASPTGGTRQLQYKLTAGKTGRKLVVDRVVEY